MEETKKLNWKPEDNNYLNKVLDVINLVLAFSIVFAPLLTSLICLLGADIDFLNVQLIIYAFYIMTKIISISLNLRFFKFRKLDLLEILATSLFLMLLITEIINAPIEFNFIFTLGYFVIFVIFRKVDKKYYKALLYSFLLTIAVCSIMGVCDLKNSYMPGFDEETYPMSLQFFNPNYSGYITTMAILLCIYVLTKFKTKWEQIVFWTVYVVLNCCLFVNGCYSAEFAMFIGELFLLLYLWIKNKKCPWVILICMILSIGASFIYVHGYSSSRANFMYESLAVLDHNFKTTLVKDVSTFFDKLFGTGIIESISGADGWGRAGAKQLAWREITASSHSIFFGYGILYNNNVLVHNVPLQIWLEYGIINLLLYASILVVLVVRLIKTKFTSYNIFMIAIMIAVIVICHYFGCLDPYSFTYFTCLLSILAREINEKWRARKENKVAVEKPNEEQKEDVVKN